MKNLVVVTVALGVVGIALTVVGAVLTGGDWVGLLLFVGGLLIGVCAPLLALLLALEELDDKPGR